MILMFSSIKYSVKSSASAIPRHVNSENDKYCMLMYHSALWRNVLLYYVVLHCVVMRCGAELHRAVLYCAVLCRAVLCCAVLRGTVLCCALI